MENLKEDLIEECCKFPKAVKSTIYRDPCVKYSTLPTIPMKGKVYDMDEKFDYVFQKLEPNYQSRFNELEEKSKNRIIKLFKAYHEWEFPTSSRALTTIQNETKVDTGRLARLLSVVGLVYSDKKKDAKKHESYYWHRLSFSSEVVLQKLIDGRQEMTDWENSYYGAHKKRVASQKRTEREFYQAVHKEESPMESLSKNVEVQQVEVKQLEKQDDFIQEFQTKYEFMVEMFPKVSKSDLQKILLYLCAKELEG